MANTIRLKSGSGNNPSASDLVVGEVALRTDGNPKLFTKNDAGNVLEVGLDSLNDKLPLAGGTLTGNLTISNTAPAIFFSDTDSENDFNIQNINGTFVIADIDAAVTRLEINSSGVATFKKNLNALEGLDVTGVITATSHIDIPDSAKIKLGTDDDLTIFHDGSNSYLQNITGNLIFKNNSSDFIRFINSDASTEVVGVLKVNDYIRSTNGYYVGTTTVINSARVLQNVTAATQSAGDNSTKIATTAYTDTAISNLVDSSPSTLNTLNELAAALGDDANFSTTVTNSIATKLPLAGGTLTGNLTLDKSGTANITIKSSDDYGTIEVGGSTGAFIDLKSPASDDYDTRFTHDGFIYAKNNITLSPTSGNVVNVARNLNALEGLDVTGDINCTSDLILDSTNTDHPRITLHSNATGIIKYAILNGQGWNPDALLIYDLDADTTRLTIEPNGLGINRGANSISHGLDVGGTAMIRGNTEIRGNILLSGDATTTNQERTIDFTGFDKEGTTDLSDRAYIRHTTNAGGLTGSVLLISSGNDSNDGIALTTNNHNSNLRLNGNIIWNAGNDGSGSGLDSDTLDGVQGSSYLRSDATDTASGAITFSSGQLHLSSHYYQLFYSGTENFIHFYPNGHSGNATTTNLRAWNGTGADVFQITGGSSTGLKWRGNTIWTAENDGAGSGLDSDTLDGIHASSFLRSDAADSCTSEINFTGGLVSKRDGNKSTQGGCALVLTHNTTSNLRMNFFIHDDFPSGKGTGYLQVTESGVSNDRHLNLQGYGGKVMIGNANATPTEMLDVNGTVKATTFSGSGASLTNIPAAQLTGILPALDGSNLTGLTVNNANTLDNLDSTQFLRSDLNDSFTAGVLTISSNQNKGLLLDRNIASPSNYYNDLQIEIRATSGTAGISLHRNGHSHCGIYHDTRNELDFDFNDGDVVVKHNAGTIWGSGNDGSGTGLDADTVDGIQGSSLLRSDANDTYTGTLSLAGHIVDSGDSRSVKLMGGTTTSQPFLGVGEQSLYGMKIRWDASSSIKFDGFWQSSVDGTPNRTLGSINVDTSTWNFPTGVLINSSTVFHAGNDGSGSGLDADKLDGVEATGFFRQGGTWAGDLASNGFTRENGLNMTGGAEFVVLSKSGQGHVLIDGTYHAYEAGGFYSYQNSAFSSQVGFYADSTTSAKWKGHLKPNADSSQDLGSTSYRWDELWVDTIQATQSIFLNGATNFDNLKNSGFYSLYNVDASGHTNAPFKYGAMITAGNTENGNGMAMQIAHERTGAGTFIRGMNDTNDTWYSWHEIWTAGVDGSGSGLDADSVDGVHASAILRSDIADNFSGTLTNNSKNETPSVTAGCINLQPSASGGRTGIIFRSNVNNTSDHGYIWWFDDLNAYRTSGDSSENGVLLIGVQNDAANAISSDTVVLESSGNIFLNPGVLSGGGLGANSWSSTHGNLYVGNASSKYKVFHEGTDGSGSGLDADTVDGIQGANLLRSDTSDTMSGTLTVTGNINCGDELKIGDDAIIEDFNAANNIRIKGVSNANAGFLSFGNQTASLGLNNNDTLIWQGNLRVDKSLEIPNTGYAIKFGPGTPSNDDAHIEWMGGNNDGRLRISTSDDSGTERIQFGDYDAQNRVGAFTEWSFIKRSEYYVNVTSHIQFNANGGGMYVYRATTSGGIIHFQSNVGGTSTLKSYINESGSLVNASDYRLKTDIAEITNGIALVKNLKPSTYKWKHDSTTTHNGFIAHELQEVLPNCVEGEKDQMKEDNETPHYQFYSDQELIPVLTAALKEAIARIEDLENKVNS